MQLTAQDLADDLLDAVEDIAASLVTGLPSQQVAEATAALRQALAILQPVGERLVEAEDECLRARLRRSMFERHKRDWNAPAKQARPAEALTVRDWG